MKNIRILLLLLVFSVISSIPEISPFNAPSAMAQASVDQWSDEINAENPKTRYLAVPIDITAYPNETLYLRFGYNERLCKQKYDDEWYSICGTSRGMTEKQMNMPTDAIRIRPTIDGTWEWDDGNRLVFSPKEQYAVNTQYTVNIPTEYFADDVSFNTGRMTPSDITVNFISDELDVYADNSFKFDPQNYKNMGVSGSFRFNYEMDTRSMESRIEITPSSRDLRLGKPSYTWSTDKKEMYFNIPVLSLTDTKNDILFIVNAGAKATSRGEGLEHIAMNIPLPTKQEIFYLEPFPLESQTQANLSSKQIFTIASTLPVEGTDVLKHMEAMLLPRNLVQNSTNQEEDKSPYTWDSYAEVTPEILTYAKPLTLTIVNNHDKSGLLHSFTFKEELPPDYTVYFRIKPGIKGPDTYTIQRDSIILEKVPFFEEELRILQNGVVLSLSGDKTLALYSRNLDEVSFELAQARPELISHLITSTDGSFSHPNGSDSDYYDDDYYYDDYYYDDYYYDDTPSIDMDSLTIIHSQDLPLVRKNAQDAQFFSLNLAPWLESGEKGIFYLETSGYRDDSSTAVITDHRFIIITDLGIIFKKNVDSSGEIYVASLDNGKPMNGVTIDVLGKNGLSIFKAETNKNGQISVPDFSGFVRDKMPVAITATFKEDFAYLPYDSSEHRENYSDFSVGGNTVSQDNIYSTMFTQRDLYRPGESVHFAFVVKQGEFNTSNLKDVPLTLILRDPRNNIFAEQDIILPKDGFGDVSFDMPITAITGAYRAELRLGKNDAILNSLIVHVEEFQPDTLNIKLELSPSQESGWLKPDQPIVSELTLTNLFGTPAADHSTEVDTSTNTASFRFSKYPGWIFYDAARLQSSKSMPTMHMQTNAKGVASFTIPEDFYSDSSVLLRIHAKAFGIGDASVVTTQDVVFVSPLDAVVGWQTSSNLEYLAQDTSVVVNVKAIDNTLDPYKFGDLTIETIDVSYMKTLVKDDNGEYSYTSLRTEEVVGSKSVNLNKKGIEFKLDTERPGEHMLIAKDTKGTVVLRLTYYVAGEAVAQFGDNNEATLSARLNKTDYSTEETLSISLSLPYAGAGLITIEREKVYMQKWFVGKAGETVQRVEIPRGLEGKAYINVTYFRDREDDDIFTSPMASTVLPFTVSMKSKDLDLQLNVPSHLEDTKTGMPIIRPGTTFPVEINTNSDAKAIVFAVDTGILQMTNYQTPKPLYDLLGNRALQVETYQYFDMLMPDYSLMEQHISAFGGDLMESEMMADMAAKGQNPFRRKGEASFAFWSGIIDVGAGKTVIDVPVPSYFSGQIRVMAVASSERGLSSSQTSVLSQAEVVIQSSLPIFATPGDIFETTVSLTDLSSPKNTQGRDVNLTVSMGDAFELIDDPKNPINLVYGKDTKLILRFRVLEELGNQEIVFEITPVDKVRGSANSTVKRSYALSVRPASMFTTTTEVGLLQKPPFKETLEFEDELYPHFSSLEASISNIPLPIVHGLMGYLEDYPYSCSEQIVSKAMPHILLLQMPQFAPKDDPNYSQEASRKEVITTLYNLASRYGYNASFRLWPDYGRETSLFQTAYIADFITEAKYTDLVLPQELLQALESMETTISMSPNSLSDARNKAYMAWVLTRNGIITTNSLANIVSWLDSNVRNWEQDITGTFIAASLKLMMQDRAAEKLIRAYVPAKANAFYWSSSFDLLTSHAFYITIVAEHFPEMLSDSKVQAVLNEMFQLIASNWYVSHSAGISTRALLRYSESLSNTDVTSSITVLNKRRDVLDIPVMYDKRSGSHSLVPATSIISQVDSIKFESSAPAFWLMQSRGYPVHKETAAVRNGIEINREFRSPEGELLTTVNAGDSVIVTIKARSRDGTLSDVMIVDLLPGGLEMVIAEGGQSVEAFTEKGAVPTDSKMQLDYVDRREDRLILSATITENETVFRYSTTASATGIFVLPPLSAQSMYNPEVYGRTANNESGGVGSQGTGFFVVD